MKDCTKVEASNYLGYLSKQTDKQYIEHQFNRIVTQSAELKRLKIRSEDGETNWLNISDKQLKKIKQILGGD